MSFFKTSCALTSLLFVVGCANPVQKEANLPPGAKVSVDGKGRLYLSGEAAKGVTLTTDQNGTIHVAHTLYMSGAQTNTDNERIRDGFKNPTVGTGSEWPFYVMKTKISCPYNWKVGMFGQEDVVITPISPGVGSTMSANIYPGMNATISGNVFVDYAGRSQLDFGIFINDVGVKRSTSLFQPRTGEMKIGTYKFFAKPEFACRAKVSLLPGPKMISYISWLQNSGRFPWNFQGGLNASGGGAEGGMYDPVNPMTGGFGKSINPEER